MIEILVSRDGREVARRAITSSPLRMGREPDNDLVLDDPACSRHHAEIRQGTGGAWVIHDLGSSNGIRNEAGRVAELSLQNGSRFRLGVFDVEVRIEAETSADSALHLRYAEGGVERSLKLVRGGEYMIGRSPAADLVLGDSGASLEHARITPSGDGFAIRDLGSSNGTLHNGARVDEARLAPGDRLRFGQTDVLVDGGGSGLRDRAALMESTVVIAREARPQGASTSAPGAPAGGLPKWLFAVGALAAVVAIVGFLWLRRPAPERAATPAPRAAKLVELEPVERRTVPFVVSTSGGVRPVDSVTISAEVPGRITELSVEESGRVQKGDVIARIDPTDLRLQLEEARSALRARELDVAREDYERTKRLHAAGAVTKGQLERAKASYFQLQTANRSARARLDTLEEQLAKATLRSPIDGIVLRKLANAGELAAPGRALLEVADLSEMIAEAEVSDREIVRMSVGQRVEARTDAWPDRVFEGRVERIASAANTRTRTFEFEVRLANAEGALKAGMIVSLRAVVDEVEGLWIPAEALLGTAAEGQSEVMVAASGRAERRDLRVGRVLDRQVEVLEGLSEGETVVVRGARDLRDGEAVEAARR